MKVCVIANRYRVDQFRWLVAGLIELGHDVFYWIDSAEGRPEAAAIKRSILDHRFDLGIGADWSFFGDPKTPLNRMLPGHPPFLNLCFNSPFDALLELSVHGDIPGFLRDNRIRLGLLSPLDRPVLADFGITDPVDLPCGIARRTLSYGDDLRLFPLGYMPADAHQRHLVDYDEVIDRQEAFFARDGLTVDPAELLYLGTADLLVDDDFPTFCFGRMTPDLPRGLKAYAAEFVTQVGFAAGRGRSERDSLIAGFLDRFPEFARRRPVDELWRRRMAAILERGHRLAERRAFCSALKDHYGPRFQLFGNDWARFGLDALPAELKLVHLRYRRAAVSLDFGSLSYDTAIFPRTADIVQDGGLLVQNQQVDSAAVFGPLAADMCFGTADELLVKAARLTADPSARLTLKANLRHRLSDIYALDRLLAAALTTVVAGPASGNSA